MRLLHTMLRVGDLDRSIDFYTHVLGMKLLRRKDYPGGKFTLAFVGYDTEDKAAVLELTYNWGVRPAASPCRMRRRNGAVVPGAAMSA